MSRRSGSPDPQRRLARSEDKDLPERRRYGRSRRQSGVLPREYPAGVAGDRMEGPRARPRLPKESLAGYPAGQAVAPADDRSARRFDKWTRAHSPRTLGWQPRYRRLALVHAARRDARRAPRRI